MKKLERLTDLIGVVGIEQRAERIPNQVEKAPDLFATPEDSQLNQMIRDKIDESSPALRSMVKMLKTANGSVTVEGSNVSDSDREALTKMIEQVQGVKSVSVDESKT